MRGLCTHLEALLLAAVRSLLGHNADALVSQHLDAEHRDPASVDKPHGLHSQHSGDDVICVVFPPTEHKYRQNVTENDEIFIFFSPDCHEPISAAADKHQSPGSQEAQEPSLHVV